jgi:amino acid adenylation domain-containing protein
MSAPYGDGLDPAPEAIVAEVVALGGEVSADGGRLRLRGSAQVLKGPIADQLRRCRDEVLQFLNGRRAAALSNGQQRLWFLQGLDPTGLGYTFSYAFRLRGPLDIRALSGALDSAVAAHPGLRAGFSDISGHAVQFIADHCRVELRVRHAVGADASLSRQFLREELVRPFDTARPPLLRSALIRTGEHEWLWGLSVHHLIADGWTCALLLRDISRAYAGMEPVVEEADYVEFVAQERSCADDPRRQADLEYWIERLAGIPDGELVPDHPRPALRTYRGALFTTTLADSTMKRLGELARAERSTLFGVLLSVHAVTFAKHTGQERVVFGIPHANRSSARFHDTAGCFVGTVILPVDLSGTPTFRELLRAVGDSCASAWDHSDFGYERLVERLAPVRDTSRNPLFQSFFAMQDVTMRLELPGIGAEPVVLDDGITQFDLETHLTPATDGTVELRFRYNADLFDAVTIEQVARRWHAMADRLAAAPDTPVRATSLVTDVDRQKMLAANRTRRPGPVQWDVSRTFAAQASRTPDHTAVRCAGYALTYRELNSRVDDLTAVLLERVPVGARIGILLPRTADMVAAVLATLRAGGCFVPLPRDLPHDRLAAIAGRVGLAAVWIDADDAVELPAGVVALRTDIAPVTGAMSLPRADDGRQAAYIMHTSGSTGVPKGVEIPDRALFNLLLSMGETPGLRAGDVLVAVTGLFFDISLLELLLPLITGATVVIATDEEVRDPVLLSALLHRSSATVLQATPSSWRMLLDSGWIGQPGLRAWCGGEPLNRDLADRLLAGCEQVWNLYGPTETTIWSACWRVQPEGPILVGTPIANTTLHILDRYGVAVPPGVSGELYIAGAGLALGYAGAPGLTAERFVPIDTADVGSVFAYRTGDLARILPEGQVRLLGRADGQMKIRGHRVEPEEIEHAIRAHPAIREVVVMLTAEHQMVAHVLTDPDADVSEPDLARFAAGRLRPVLIPQRFVIHVELPRTANGKIDRKVLGATVLPSPASGEAVQAPNTPDESLVASVFQDILGVGPIGRDHDFFGLGGHSLAATRVLYRLEQARGIQIPMHIFMQDASVRTIAELLSGLDDELLAALALVESMSEQDAAALSDTTHEKADTR